MRPHIKLSDFSYFSLNDVLLEWWWTGWCDGHWGTFREYINILVSRLTMASTVMLLLFTIIMNNVTIYDEWFALHNVKHNGFHVGRVVDERHKLVIYATKIVSVKGKGKPENPKRTPYPLSKVNLFPTFYRQPVCKSE